MLKTDDKKISTFDYELTNCTQSFIETIVRLTQTHVLHVLERSLDRDSPVLVEINNLKKTVRDLRKKYADQGKVRKLYSRDYIVLMGGYEQALAAIEGQGFNRAETYLFSNYWRCKGMACWRLRRSEPHAHYVGSWCHVKLVSPIILLWWFVSNCGQSLFRWCLSVLLLILIFAFFSMPTPNWLEPMFPTWLDPLRPQVEHSNGTSPSILECVYFSGVTFTTLGYGDIKPVNSIAMILAVVEAGTGLTMFVVLGHMLSTLIIRKQIPKRRQTPSHGGDQNDNSCAGNKKFEHYISPGEPTFGCCCLRGPSSGTRRVSLAVRTLR